MSSPRTTLVYDLPTRLFHGLFAGLFVTAFVIANGSDDSPAFPYHMLAGTLLAGLVLFRLIWGFIGTRHARFGSFVLSPRRLAEYFSAMFSGDGRKWAGHNPASSWAALIMLGLAAGLALTGVHMVTGGDRERFEEVHELLANSFLAVALLHIVGVVLHSLRHRDGFAGSMVDGHKDAAGTEAISQARPLVAAVLLASILALGVHLVRGYDPASGKLDAFGLSMALGESDNENESQSRVAGGEREDEHDED
jgi:cytochrome b